MSEDLSLNALFGVQGKVVVITGGGTGLGFMMASAFIQNGAHVIIAGRREDVLKKAVKDLTAQAGQKGGKADYIVGDVKNKEGTEAIGAQVSKKVSKVHVLINNAGIAKAGPLENYPEAAWTDSFALNTTSGFYMTAALVKLLAKDATNIDPGRVINISSIFGFETKVHGGGLVPPGMGNWSYATSKAACNALTRQLAASLGPQHILVNAILPGVFPSEMTAKVTIKKEGEIPYGVKHNYVNGRIGTAEDLSGLVICLASRGSAHTTGALIPCDGGQYFSGIRQ